MRKELDQYNLLLSLLVLSTAGGMGQGATTFYKCMALMLSERNEQHYSQVLHWIRCRLNFSLLQSFIMCLRGARSSYHHPANSRLNSGHIDLVLAEGKLL